MAGPFDVSHLYLQWGGKLPGTESWSCGLRMINVGSVQDPVSAAPGLIAGAKTAVQAMHVAATVNLHTAAKLSFVKLNAVGTDGTYISDATNLVAVADVGGASSGVQPPNQVALAVSLTTGYSRGPAHRGRYYLPLPVKTLDSGGLIPAADAINVSGATDTFIAALNALSPSWAVAVMSRKVGAPAHRVVTGNLVGRVLDTQRRRRRSMVEDYQ